MEFFLERGFELWFCEDSGLVWANLRSIRDSSFTLSKYGRGTDESSAAQRAVERWRAEQAT
jgi:hypothetical protein